MVGASVGVKYSESVSLLRLSWSKATRDLLAGLVAVRILEEGGLGLREKESLASFSHEQTVLTESLR